MVPVRHGLPRSLRCHKCGGLHGKGRRRNHDGQGYISLILHPDDPWVGMGNARRHVLEHRLIMAKSLGRLLTRNEQVHHKNGIRDDNRLENLELLSKADHSRLHLRNVTDLLRHGQAMAGYDYLS